MLVAIPVKPLLIIVSCILMWQGIRGLREDKVMEDGGEIIERASSPEHYWIAITVYFLLSAAGFVFAFIAC